MRVSVVVPTYRRRDLLARCLRALRAQDFDPAEYEVLVADDAASDDTRKQVEKISQGLPAVRYVRVTETHGPAAARNAGWRAAQGAIIAFTDDDCVPDSHWLSAGVTEFAQGADAIWGAIRIPVPPRPTDYERNEAGLARAEFATANCFCRRDVLQTVGGLDERFTMAWREDADLFFTLLEQGYRVVHVPQARVMHPIRPGRWGISSSQQRKSLFNALLYKKHPALYRARIQAGPPWHYYGACLGFLAALSGAMGGWPALTWTGAAVWLGLTARFCARRLHGTSHAPSHICEMLVTSLLIPFLSIYWRLRGAFRFRVLFL